MTARGEHYAPLQKTLGALPDSDLALARFILGLRKSVLVDPAITNAFEQTPREAFFSKNLAPYLYKPCTLPIACGAEATSPHLIARALAALEIEPHHVILEIGTGSGFQTALLCRIATHVDSVERYATLHRAARKTLENLSITNVTLQYGDGLAPLLQKTLYDRIIINGAVTRAPPSLITRLASKGKLLVPILRNNEQRLCLFKTEDLKIEDSATNARPTRLLTFSRFQPLIPGIAKAI